MDRMKMDEQDEKLLRKRTRRNSLDPHLVHLA
jgi:hypothetical protein